MSRILIAISSVDGHTQRIGQQLQKHLQAAHHEVELDAIENRMAIAPHAYDHILVGASIRYGKFRPALYAFIQKNFAVLQATPNAFFSVNLVARKPGKDTPEGSPYTQRFIDQSGWQPEHMAVFAGRLHYARYGFLDRHMIRLIMWITKGPTALDTDQDFTDWGKVERFAQTAIAGKKDTIE